MKAQRSGTVIATFIPASLAIFEDKFEDSVNEENSYNSNRSTLRTNEPIIIFPLVISAPALYIENAQGSSKPIDSNEHYSKVEGDCRCRLRACVVM